MTSLVDSSAQYELRLRELGFDTPFTDALKAAGVRNLSNLAFTVGQPGQPLADNVVTNFLQTALGRAPSLQEVSSIKRLAFEAQTLLVATLRQQVEQKEDGEPRKIGFAERSTRMEALQRALSGVAIEGELEPAHSLLDRVCSMYEQNTVKYFEPSTCVSRALEVQGTTKSRELTLEKGSLVMRSNDDKLQASTDSEIKLHYAFVRRAISLEFARIMSYAQHNTWETFLFESVHRDPPPGFNRPSLSQIIQCDKAAWSKLASSCKAVRQAADGSCPFGEALLALRNDPLIALYLTPTAKAQVVEKPNNYNRHAPYDNPKGGPKGKGKGKKGSKSAPPMPKELRGKWHRTPGGDPICYAFNTAAGCSQDVKPGDRCAKGFHVCMEPKCQKSHSLTQHS